MNARWKRVPDCSGSNTKATEGKGSANVRNRQVFAERRERVECDNWEGMEVSRLSGAEYIVGQHGKFEFFALLNRKQYCTIRELCVHVTLNSKLSWRCCEDT